MRKSQQKDSGNELLNFIVRGTHLEKIKKCLINWLNKVETVTLVTLPKAFS